jgi:pyruvate dehydrogenase E1 component alpha subunit
MMLRIRRFAEKLVLLFKRSELPDFLYLHIGEEAIASGICSDLPDGDRITTTHRGGGHVIAKGCDLGRMMAKLYGHNGILVDVGETAPVGIVLARVVPP